MIEVICIESIGMERFAMIGMELLERKDLH